METPVVISLVSLFIALMFGALTHFRTKSFSDLVERVAKVETRVEVYFDLQEKYNAQILHRADDGHRLDAILEKRQQLEPVTRTEADVLEEKLEQILADESQPAGTRAAAGQMLAVRKARNAQC